MSPTRVWQLAGSIGIVAAFLLSPLFAGAADVELSEDVVVADASTAAAGFGLLTERFVGGETVTYENPVFRTGEDGTIDLVTVSYEGDAPASQGLPGVDYTVTIRAGGCDGCDSIDAIETRLLATEMGAAAEYWYGQPEMCVDDVFWPCLDDHRLAGGVGAAELYGFSLYDRNAGVALSTHTAVAGDYTVTVEATTLTYDNYTTVYLGEFRPPVLALTELYVAHLLDISGSATSGSGSATSGPAPVGFVAPVAAIGALAAIAAVAATAIASTAVASTAVASTAVASTDVASTVGGTAAQPVFVDPDTGQALPVDGNQVWFGEWMTPADAQQAIDARIEEIALDDQAAALHQQFVATQQSARDDELSQLGYTFDDASKTWKPGPDTPAIIDQHWQDKIDQDPAWQGIQQNFAAIQYELDMAKQHMLQSHNWSLQQEHDIHMAHDAVLQKWEWAAKAVQSVADTSIGVLEKVTGPAGTAVKRVYTFTKTAAGELADKGVSGKTLLTATLKGFSDVALDDVVGKIPAASRWDAGGLLKQFDQTEDLARQGVQQVFKQLLAGDKRMLANFAPGVWGSAQGEIYNWLGVRPIGDDLKQVMGALGGDDGDAESLVTDPTYPEFMFKLLTGGRTR